MNKCLNCGKEVKNKYCNVSCQNIHQGTIRADKRLGVFMIFNVKCKKCGKDFEVNEREKLFPQKEHYYCSRSCANSRYHSDETKNKISKSLIKYDKTLIIKKIKPEKIVTTCKNCSKEIEHTTNVKRIFCSHSCCTTYYNLNTDRCHINGLKSCIVQKEKRRSKNEIYFSELCISFFKNVSINESIFNGWDADVILNDDKIAILWNGKWHYKKIKKEHSVKQVQNRDRIKIIEIEKMNYKPYIIKDMGKYNKNFVEQEFQKLKKYIAG